MIYSIFVKRDDNTWAEYATVLYDTNEEANGRLAAERGKYPGSEFRLLMVSGTPV